MSLYARVQRLEQRAPVPRRRCRLCDQGAGVADFLSIPGAPACPGCSRHYVARSADDSIVLTDAGGREWRSPEVDLEPVRAQIEVAALQAEFATGQVSLAKVLRALADAERHAPSGEPEEWA